MDGPRDKYSNWSKPDKDKYCNTYIGHLKHWYRWNYLQNRNRLTDKERNLQLLKGRGEVKVRSLGLKYTHFYI